MTFDPAINNPVHTMSQFGPNWIIKVLPDLEDQALADMFDLSPGVGIEDPGAGNRNIEARGTSISVLLCPSDPNNQTKYTGHGGNWARGNYAASAGRAFIYGNPLPGANPSEAHMSGPYSKSWSGKVWSAGDNLYCRRGVMGPNVGIELKQITDGTSKTIMVGEIRAGIVPEDPRGTWALGHAGASLIARYGGGGDANGPNACYSNSDDIPLAAYDDPAAVCAAPGESTTALECMTVSHGGFDQATVRSRHPGGAHVAMADASVQFISDDIETTGCYGPCCSVWDFMITSSDNGNGGTFNGVSARANYCQ
jgi:prepilin-type processing-associated H-X9-DG protein